MNGAISGTKTTENQEVYLMEQSSSQRPLRVLVDLNR